MLDHIRNALLSIWSNKVRSILNILGVVIGVSSVTILIALGEGLKQDVSGLIQSFGTNVIAITGGKIEAGNFSQTGTNPANFISGDIFSRRDLTAIEALPDIAVVSPATILPGSLKYNDKTIAPIVFGSYPNFLDAFAILKIDKGQMFSRRDQGKVIVIGHSPAQTLFGETNPIGQSVTLGKTELEVIGTLKGANQPSLFGSEFDNFSLVPFDTATEINKGQAKILRIYVKARQTADVNQLKTDIKALLLQNHNGEEDFTVLTQEDMLALFATFLSLVTTLTSSIAAISLIVGGIGIMNIMLVTVTERTREIGLRKAVGATKLAILWQFLIEAIVVTFMGSLIGLLLAFAVAAMVAAKTELQPVITSMVILIAVGVAVGIGIIFGLWPAIRAANKDPIEALRYE